MIEREGDGFRLHYGDLCVPFVVESGARRRLSITVFPDGRLRVLAPDAASTDAVLERVNRRAKWIAKQWEFFQNAPVPTPPRLYISGETHLYLGRQYRLKVCEIETASEAESVKLSGRFFWVRTHNRSDTVHTKKLLDAWYQAHATTIFSARLGQCLIKVRGLDPQSAPPMEVRRMTKRWGSCTASGRVLLNLELVKTPLACVDYVLIHELCHLLIPRHNPEYYALLTRCLPDWKERKKQLEKFGL